MHFLSITTFTTVTKKIVSDYKTTLNIFLISYINPRVYILKDNF